MASSNDLPKMMKALYLRSTSEPPTVESIPTPQPTLGSAVVRNLAAASLSYGREIYNGKRNYPFPVPLVPGYTSIAHVVAVGPDATKLKPGDLVFVDSTVRSRDDPTDVFLAAVHEGYTAGSKKLMRDVFRNWVMAEYCLTPLENLTLLNEKRLTGELGYSYAQLSYIAALLVPYGGLRDIELRAGQTIIVAPATGQFGGAAVLVALGTYAHNISIRLSSDIENVVDI